MDNFDDYRPCPDGRKIDRTIVLMGRTGKGKSTLANVIAGRYKGDLFPESSSPTSKTQGLPTKTVLVPYAGHDYAVKIIDTIGFCDNRFTEEQVLLELAHLAHTCSGGINQIIFITNGRFTQEERQASDSVIDVIFQPQVAPFCTLVRTRTPGGELREDVISAKTQAYKEESVALHPSLGRINTFLMVSNPDDGDDHSYEVRRRTRKRMVEHIILHYQAVYVPPLFAEVKGRIDGHIQQKTETERKLQQLQEDLAAARISDAEFKRSNAEELERLKRINGELTAKVKEELPWWKTALKKLGQVASTVLRDMIVPRLVWAWSPQVLTAV
ncbi:uncharacterized protein LOC135829629 isoform X1 [Sycon ciliatum]|uniref:uncharacterized protein LOC135829629 isoform X1 n=1 Tax=Sycon ciliatum TaxID=27933 RepID=UPI0031F62CE3